MGRFISRGDQNSRFLAIRRLQLTSSAPRIAHSLTNILKWFVVRQQKLKFVNHPSPDAFQCKFLRLRQLVRREQFDELFRLLSIGILIEFGVLEIRCIKSQRRHKKLIAVSHQLNMRWVSCCSFTFSHVNRSC